MKKVQDVKKVIPSIVIPQVDTITNIAEKAQLIKEEFKEKAKK